MIQVRNNVISFLAAPLSATDTIMEVVPGSESSFPPLTSSEDYFFLTITGFNGSFEIVRVTSTSSNQFEIVRAQEGTIAKPFPVNSKVELKITVQTVYDMVTQSRVPIRFAYPTVQAMLADDRHFPVDSYVMATEFGFVYKVVGPTEFFHLQNAGGLKFICVPGDTDSVNLLAMGVAKDGSEDVYWALQKLCDTIIRTVPGSNYMRGLTIYVPYGTYNISDTIDIKTTVQIVGNGAGLGNSFVQSPNLTFPAGKKGFMLRFRDPGEPVGDPPVNPPATHRSQGPMLKGLSILSNVLDFNAPKVHHAIHTNVRCALEDLFIDRFHGDGIRIEAAVGPPTNDIRHGNANGFSLRRIRTQRNAGWGVYVDGPDTNAGIGSEIDASGNGVGGILDSSFLGNTWTGCHTASNGLANRAANGPNRSSVVWHDGYLWHATVTESFNRNNSSGSGNWPSLFPLAGTLLAANEPGVSSESDGVFWWRFKASSGPSSSYPQWQPNQPPDTYFLGASYVADNLNEATVFIGCYLESDQLAWIQRPSIVVGGTFGVLPQSTGARLRATSLGFRTGIGVFGVTDDAQVGLAGNSALLWWDDGAQPYRLRKFDEDFLLDYSNLATTRYLRLTGRNSTTTFGRTSPQLFEVEFPKGVFIGSVSRKFQTVSSVTSLNGQEVARGDRFFIQPATAGQPHMYVVTTGGVVGDTAVLKHTGNLEA
ncbi:MAG: glycosyl hydrolase family 28-related protein [Candidatus Caldarchaeum sp.]